jgi:hypothetical protein
MLRLRIRLFIHPMIKTCFQWVEHTKNGVICQAKILARPAPRIFSHLLKDDLPEEFNPLQEKTIKRGPGQTNGLA